MKRLQQAALCRSASNGSGRFLKLIAAPDSWTCLLKEAVVSWCWAGMVMGGVLMLRLAGCLHLRRDSGIVQGEHTVQDLSHPLSCMRTGSSAGCQHRKPSQPPMSRSPNRPPAVSTTKQRYKDGAHTLLDQLER